VKTLVLRGAGGREAAAGRLRGHLHDDGPSVSGEVTTATPGARWARWRWAYFRAKSGRSKFTRELAEESVQRKRWNTSVGTPLRTPPAPLIKSIRGSDRTRPFYWLAACSRGQERALSGTTVRDLASEDVGTPIAGIAAGGCAMQACEFRWDCGVPAHVGGRR